MNGEGEEGVSGASAMAERLSASVRKLKEKVYPSRTKGVPTVMSHGVGCSSSGLLLAMVTDDSRFSVKVTARAARADWMVAAARNRQMVVERRFMVFCGDASQAVAQRSMNGDDVELSGRCAKWSRERVWRRDGSCC